jgi:hypothetical protein
MQRQVASVYSYRTRLLQSSGLIGPTFDLSYSLCRPKLEYTEIGWPS